MRIAGGEDSPSTLLEAGVAVAVVLVGVEGRWRSFEAVSKGWPLGSTHS
jgi:hypothetical protein